MISLLFLSAQQVYPQVQTWLEDFDGMSVKFNAMPPGSWKFNTVYTLPGSSTTSPQSYWGLVPNRVGDTTWLYSTENYDFDQKPHVELRFSHICKISPKDRVIIQYKRGGESIWYTIDARDYLGNASNYASTGFNAASYPEWSANDSIVFPAQSWWKEEVFDLSAELGYNTGAEFRFIIVHGSTPGTQISYGWLLENVQVTASPNELKKPIVEFVSPLVRDTVFGAGPWEIRARVKTTTAAQIEVPTLTYTATENGSFIETENILMSYEGNDIWVCSIKQFEPGIKVSYSITGKDATNNEETIDSEYIIKMGNATKGTLLQNLQSTNSEMPFDPYSGYSQCMILYTSDEIAGGSGHISSLGLHIQQGTTGYYPIRLWLKTVPSTKTDFSMASDDLDWSVLTQDAKLVFEGDFYFPAPGWTDIPFDEFFYYSDQENLVVMIEQLCGGWDCWGVAGYPFARFYLGDASENQFFYRSAYNVPPVPPTTLGGVSFTRPDLRIDIIREPTDNSAAMFSIDIADTVWVAPGVTTPINMIVQNKGKNPLNSAIIHYTLNGGPVVDIPWNTQNPPIWGFNTPVITGNTYTPKIKGYDTLMVWVSDPNGIDDPVKLDDTLVKYIYGSPTIEGEFVDQYRDSVYFVGPYTIKIHLRSLSLIPVPTPVELVYIVTDNGIQQNPVTVEMTYEGDDIWSCTLPKYQWGTRIDYSVSLEDDKNNPVVFSSWFCNTRPKGGDPVLQDTKGMCDIYPFMPYYGYSQSMSLYTQAEIGNYSGNMTELALQLCQPAYGSSLPIKIWLKTVPATKTAFTFADDIDWSLLTQDATLVYDNDFIFDYQADNGDWITIPFENEFTYDGGNLIVLFEQNCGGWGGCAYPYFYANNVPSSCVDQFFMRYEDNIPPSAGHWSLEINYLRPDMRIKIIAKPPVLNSAGLLSFDNPEGDNTPGGELTDIAVQLENVGTNKLDSVLIDYWLNGIHQTQINHHTNIYPGLDEIISLGDYTSKVGSYDTILVIISMPNGQEDSLKKDDTLYRVIFGCPDNLSNNIVVGTLPGANFRTISDAIASVRYCRPPGDITISLQNGTYRENVDIGFIENMGSDKLILKSLSNNAANVFLEGIEYGIRTGEVSNIEIKDITINLTGEEGTGILLGEGSNIEILRCVINMDPDAINTGSFQTGIYRPYSENISYDVRIKNNIINGGSYGAMIISGQYDNYGTDWIYDSNIVKNASIASVVIENTDLFSVSYNTCFLANNIELYEWAGFIFSNCEIAEIAYNKIHALNHPYLEVPRAMSFYDVNMFGNPMQLYNNEIMVSKNGEAMIPGYDDIVILEGATSANIYHNSIYVAGTEESFSNALYIASYEMVDVLNNNIAFPLGCPIFILEYSTTMDYNNYYTTGNILGVYNWDVASDLKSWQMLTYQDVNSSNSDPLFVNLSVSLDAQSPYLLCPALQDIPVDITEQLRTTYSYTNMGAYTSKPYSQNVASLILHNWPQEVVLGYDHPLDVSIQNASTASIQNAVIKWSVNGGVPSSYTWTPTPVVDTYEKTIVRIGTLPINSNITNIRVWFETINGIANYVKDTAYGMVEAKPLAEFVQPFIKDTIYDLAFDVYLLIRDMTGAPVTPLLNITTIVNGAQALVSSVPIHNVNGELWRARIPQQYYGSNVIYSATISDINGYQITIKDSVYIKFTGFGTDTVTIGTGTTISGYNPFSTYDYSMSRNYYMSYEITPQQSGGMINSISFNNVGGLNVFSDIYFYMKATSDFSVASNTYIDPLNDGATQVFAGGMIVMPGWNEIILDNPFYLPPGQNLLIYCDNQSGIYGGNSVTWECSVISPRMSLAINDWCFPPGSCYPTIEYASIRPDIKISITSLSSPYTGHNLGLLSMASPVNIQGELCTDDYSQVEVVLTNLGEENYDFSQDAISIGMEITNPRGNKYHSIQTVNNGVLASGKNQVIELMRNLPTMYSGVYTIKSWVESSIDGVLYDDTIIHTFTSDRVGLPIDENFSNGLPNQFVSNKINSTSKWEICNGSSGLVDPYVGTGMLRFEGTRGSMSVISTRQLTLYQTSNPYLEFWYYHDNTVSDDDYSYTDVNVIVNGVSKTLGTIKLKSNVSGWKQYTYQLNQFTSIPGCALIQFESMNSNNNSVQYLDWIQIISQRDLMLSEIILSDLSVCALGTNELKVVRTTTANQMIDFSQYSTSIQLDITGPINHSSSVLLSDILEGNELDTLPIVSDIKFVPGEYTIKAYLTSPIDDNPVNDTVRTTITITPSFEITIEKLSKDAPALAGFEYEQKITITNTGNMELSDIGLILSVTSDDGTYTFNARDIFNQALQPNGTADFTFSQAYTVPWCENYTVKVHGYLICDSMLFNKDFSIQEAVNMIDLKLVSIEKPEDDGAIDIIGSSMEVTVNVQNLSPGKAYASGEAKAGIMLMDTNGNPVNTLPLEELPTIGSAIMSNASITYTFDGKYTVPNLKEYYLIVYIDGTDQYKQNDTLKLRRSTNYVGLNDLSKASFTMEQNIPNPAKGNTIIHYSIPQDGEITFQLYSISGQLLYTEQESVPLGEHQIELNLSDYASGVYFYTMEYNGRRISKRMTVK